jgi:hypothetical protein
MRTAIVIILSILPIIVFANTYLSSQGRASSGRYVCQDISNPNNTNGFDDLSSSNILSAVNSLTCDPSKGVDTTVVGSHGVKAIVCCYQQ